MGRLEQLCAHYLESAVSVGNVLAALTSCASQMPALHFFKEFCLRFIIKDSNYNQVSVIISFAIQTENFKLCFNSRVRGVVQKTPGFGIIPS